MRGVLRSSQYCQAFSAPTLMPALAEQTMTAAPDTRRASYTSPTKSK